MIHSWILFYCKSDFNKMKFGRYKNKQIKVSVSIVFNWLFPDTISSDKSSIDKLPYILGDHYFDSIMISNIRKSQNRKKIKEMLKESHIEVSYAAAFPIYFENLNPSTADQKLRKKTLERLKECIDEAYYFNARTFLIFSGDDPGKDKRKFAKEKLVETLNDLCRYCYDKSEDYLLKITLEPGDRELAKKFLLGPSNEVVEVCNLVKENYDNFGVTIDLAHIFLSQEEPAKYIHNLKDYIEEVHINNCIMNDKAHPLFGDKHVLFGIEEGEIDTEVIVDFLKILRDLRYFYRKRPIVTFEVTPTVGQDVNIVIANFKRVFNESWYRIQED